jgi:hypothetical protein
MKGRRWLLVGVGSAAVSGALGEAAGCTAGGPAGPPALGVAAFSDGATDAPCVDHPPPDAGRVHVTGLVVESSGPDGGTPGVIPNAMVAVEYGGLYLPWCDLSKASPYYVYGAVTDDGGRFDIDVVPGSLGFHSFADGYLYTRAPLDTNTGNTVSLAMERLPNDQAQPKLTGPAFDKSTVAPGEIVTFTSTVATWSTTDPLSDENLLVEGTHSWSAELDPPGRGKKDDFPDGLWKLSFAAPKEPGTYTYWFSATTSTCITSSLFHTTLTVR